jgi:hypothetical protein
VQILFNKTIEQCRQLGACGGRAHARNLRLRQTQAPVQPGAETPGPPSETAPKPVRAWTRNFPGWQGPSLACFWSCESAFRISRSSVTKLLWAKCSRQEPVRRFECFTADLHRLADWLEACGVETIAMQSTGVYWIPLYEILEERGFEVYLVNARHTRNLPGRESDVQESQWLLKLHTYGLLHNSFQPTAEIRVARTYWRQRGEHVHGASTCIQRMQKVLTQMNVQLANVISDLSGLTKGVLDPVRPLIPILAGDDIGMSVAVDISNGAGFESARVDHMERERNLVTDAWPPTPRAQLSAAAEPKPRFSLLIPPIRPSDSKDNLKK